MAQKLWGRGRLPPIGTLPPMVAYAKKAMPKPGFLGSAGATGMAEPPGRAGAGPRKAQALNGAGYPVGDVHTKTSGCGGGHVVLRIASVPAAAHSTPSPRWRSLCTVTTGPPRVPLGLHRDLSSAAQPDQQGCSHRMRRAREPWG